MWKLIFHYIKPYVEKWLPKFIQPIIDANLESFKSDLRKNEFEFNAINQGSFTSQGFLLTLDKLSVEERSLTELIPALRVSYPNLSLKEAENALVSCCMAKDKISPAILSEFIKHNPDWFNEFMKLSGKFSSNEAHELWSSVLTVEAKNPDSISYRTMQAIASLTPEECSWFKSLLPYVIDNKYIFYSSYISEKSKARAFSEMLFELEDIGILKFVSSSVNLNINTSIVNGFEGVTFNTIHKKLTVYIGDRVTENERGNKIINMVRPPSIRTIDLTKTGREIFQVLANYDMGDSTLQIDYLGSIGEYIKNNMFPTSVKYSILDKE